MRILKTPVSGDFAHLRHLALDLRRHKRFAMAAELPSDLAGMIYVLPERPSALCVSVIRNDVRGRSVQTLPYHFAWDVR